MSNWRINFGLGPLRYTKRVGGRRKPAAEQKQGGRLASIITLVVVFGAMYLCCWGGVAWLNSQP